MRSYLSKATFFKKMKKKPALQAVLDDIENYTEEQIDALTGTHFPQWIKDQLKELQKRGGKTSEDEAQRIADLMIAASQKSDK
jgi:hypothetical protein